MALIKIGKMDRAVDVVGVIEKLQLERAYVSGGNVMACCPNPTHAERTPSFGVNLRNGKFNCFGCGYKGGLTKLVMDLQKVDLKTAERMMVTARSSNGEWKGILTPKLEDKREFKIWPESTLDFLDKKYGYLESRGVSQGVQEEWGVRYSEADERYVVPVRHIDGNIVGLVGIADENLRAEILRIKEDGGRAPKKVLYTPGLYISKTMFGINRLNGRIAILVEGVIDALKVYEAIRKPIVCAILNSSVSTGQSVLLKRAGVKKVLCMFDNDEAGEKALHTAQKNLGGSMIVQRVPYDAPDPGEMKVEQIRKILFRN